MAEINFEKSIERLDEIAAKLEKGGLSLDEMINLYTEGSKLAAECKKALDKAELKITKISAEGSEADE